MGKIRIYLDNCCFNRPYDDQAQPRIQFETSAKLMTQSLILDGQIEFVWSYVLEFENSKNPFPEKRETILAFKQYASVIVEPDKTIENVAKELQLKGFKAYDSLHLACAISVGCDYILTVDDKMLNNTCDDITIIDPVIFIYQWLKEGSTQ
jgi:predicted nucleic acid-binding protein